MAYQKKGNVRNRGLVYTTDENWEKVKKLQEYYQLRTRANLIDFAVKRLYDETFNENGDPKNNN